MYEIKLIKNENETVLKDVIFHNFPESFKEGNVMLVVFKDASKMLITVNRWDQILMPKEAFVVEKNEKKKIDPKKGLSGNGSGK